MLLLSVFILIGKKNYLSITLHVLCQVKGIFPASFRLVRLAIWKELSGQDFLILMTYRLTYRLTVKILSGAQLDT